VRGAKLCGAEVRGAKHADEGAHHWCRRLLWTAPKALFRGKHIDFLIQVAVYTAASLHE